MKFLSLLFLSLLFMSCKKDTNNHIKGDLFFKMINPSSQSGYNKTEIEKMNLLIDSIKLKQGNQNEIVKYYEVLKNNNLLDKPYIHLKIENNIKIVFMAKSQFLKVKKYKLDDLNKRNKKVEIELEVNKISEDILFSNQITSVKEIDGKTEFKK